ncbi:MAG: imidazolonepropionase [Bacteroidales bacterium]|nr:imidazolonepropionase [Bacteroidales bacterium]
MDKLLIINIKELLQAGEEIILKRGVEMDDVNCIENAYVYAVDGRIADYGEMKNLPAELEMLVKAWNNADPHEKEACNPADTVEVIDAEGRIVMPSFCDSHTHLIYAGSREREFVDKIKGLSYQQIAANGGGILNSALLLENTSEDDLYSSALGRAYEIIASGTGAVEIKSGYGLSLDTELKMLRVAKRLQQNLPIPVKTTFLGAHAVPARYAGNKEGYVDEIINTMIPVVASHELADYIDVFCEDGFFSVEDTDRILNAGMKHGMRAKVHANQMGVSGGVQVGVKYDAISVDHLESVGEAEIEALKNSGTIATMLPGATFFLNMDYSPARKFVENDIPLALATNYNPGSCPSGSMQFQMALACIAMKLTPQQAFNACTINGAYAMGLEDEVGSITVGKRANFIITKKIPSLDFIPYAFTTPFIEKIILDGKQIEIQ